MRRMTAVLVAAMVLLPIAVNARTKKRPVKKQLSAIELVEKVNDRWQATHKPEMNAFWDNAAYFTGNMEAYKLTGNARWLEYADKWARHNRWSGAREQDKSKWKYKNYGEGQDYVLFGDWQICFQTYLDMYAMNPDDYKIARTREVMDYECALGNTDFWWWADGLYMVMPVMTKLYKVTGDTKYLDKLTANFVYADNLMFDKEAQLYYRDGKYVYPKHKTDDGKKDFWARGDGWVLAGLAKVLADMPVSYAGRSLFVDRFRQLAEGVSRCQQPQGYWTRSMLDPKQAEGPETSGTAFLTYGLLWGINNGVLDRSTFLPVVNKAWSYLTTVALQEDGSVGYVQPIGEKAIKGQTLSAGNTANFGTGAFLLAACEKQRFDDNSVSPYDAKAFKVVVKNDRNTFRQEVVELDAATVFARLGIRGGRQFKVINACGQEVPYQLTHDGLLLVEASVRPQGSASFTLMKGTPSVFHNTCYGRMYPERVDDIAWENDRSAYRCYGPALQLTGERAFGNDVWLKNTPDLVVEQRYFTEDVNKPVIAKLRKSDPAAADALNMKTSYHFDHGNGLDCYKVGPTLGCGTPALLDGDSIVYPYCYKDYEILDNGPLRFTVSLTYHPTEYQGGKVVEHRILSLDKGSNFNKMTVWYEGLAKPADVVAGVVIHSEDTMRVVLGKDYVQYADPTDAPDRQNFQIYVAALFPYGVSQTVKRIFAHPSNGNAGHALGIMRQVRDSQRVTYCFGSAWSKYDCKSQQEWQARIDGYMDALRNPLVVEFLR